LKFLKPPLPAKAVFPLFQRSEGLLRRIPSVLDKKEGKFVVRTLNCFQNISSIKEFPHL
jgi:hypothetical protein